MILSLYTLSPKHLLIKSSVSFILIYCLSTSRYLSHLKQKTSKSKITLCSGGLKLIESKLFCVFDSSLLIFMVFAFITICLCCFTPRTVLLLACGSLTSLIFKGFSLVNLRNSFFMIFPNFFPYSSDFSSTIINCSLAISAKLFKYFYYFLLRLSYCCILRSIYQCYLSLPYIAICIHCLL